MGKLFFASFVMLFAETMAIRWLGIEIPVIRAFPNLILMLAFIGASAGIAQPAQKVSPLKVALAIACLVLSVVLVPLTPLCQVSLRIGDGNSPLSVAQGLALILLNSFSVLYLFKQVGAWVGAEFKDRPPLAAYSVNLLGSLAGVAAFALCSWLRCPPYIWLVVLAVSIYAYNRSLRLLALFVPLIVAAFFACQNAYWSPYGKLEVLNFNVPADSVFGKGNYMLFCNNLYFHSAIHVPTKEEFARRPADAPAVGVAGGAAQAAAAVHEKNGNKQNDDHLLAHSYRWHGIPYRMAQHHDDILVLGAGSGNDTAFGLKEARHLNKIDAVEIDPVIGYFGQTVHPDKPYIDPKVNLIVNDARWHLHDTDKKYDMILFADLDPGATLNTASFMRVDNYVYTLESLKSAYACLKPDGVMSLAFATGADHPVTVRLYNTIKAATGEDPVVLVDRSYESCMFLLGPGLRKDKAAFDARLKECLAYDTELSLWSPNDEQRKVRIATDDWPFLYLQFDAVGMVLYSVVLAVIIFLPVPFLFKAEKVSLLAPQSFSMFVLGEAFMLMETKCCTELSLQFGNTWVVSSVVIFSFLTLSFLANLLVLRLDDRRLHSLMPAVYGLLTLVLLLNFFLSAQAIALPAAGAKAITTFISCLPVFFGGIIFSSHFKRATDPNMALAANLLGVTFGGLLENLCVVGGVKSLSLISLLLYLLSALPLLRKGAVSAEVADVQP